MSKLTKKDVWCLDEGTLRKCIKFPLCQHRKLTETYRLVEARNALKQQKPHGVDFGQCQCSQCDFWKEKIDEFLLGEKE